MALLEDGRLVEDRYLPIGDDDPLPDAPALIPLDRLRREGAALAGRRAPLGVALPAEADPAILAPWLPRLSLVTLRLAKHRDGRAFTQARRLRERLGFRGEIRATGHVIADQYLFLLRCGVSSVAVPEGTDPAVWDAARRVIPTAYQPAITGDRPLSLLRRHLHLA
jgi:uncharacterized protein (DUF934 family)